MSERHVYMNVWEGWKGTPKTLELESPIIVIYLAVGPGKLSLKEKQAFILAAEPSLTIPFCCRLIRPHIPTTTSSKLTMEEDNGPMETPPEK